MRPGAVSGGGAAINGQSDLSKQWDRLKYPLLTWNSEDVPSSSSTFIQTSEPYWTAETSSNETYSELMVRCPILQ